MSKSLGICVKSSDYGHHLLGLVSAAKKECIKTDVFLTGDGVKVSQESSFGEVIDLADRIGICEYSFLKCGYKKESIKKLTEKNFVTQMRNADILAHCDRYLVL